MAADDSRIEARAAVVDAVAQAAVEIPVESAPAEPAPVESAPADQARVLTPEQEARALVDLCAEMALPFFPSLRDVYGEDARARLAAAGAPLLAKYGVTVGSLFARWKEEIEFAAVAAPLLLQSVRIIQAERAAKDKPADTKAPDAPSVPESAAPITVQ